MNLPELMKSSVAKGKAILKIKKAKRQRKASAFCFLAIAARILTMRNHNFSDKIVIFYKNSKGQKQL